MDRKAKAQASATSQHARFLETARELGADQDTDALDRVFGKVVPPVVPEAKRAPWPTYRVAPGGRTSEGWVVVPEPTEEHPHPGAVAGFDTKAEAEAEADRRNAHAEK
jgi:hypothetical protein